MDDESKWSVLSEGMENYALMLDDEDNQLDEADPGDKPGGSNAGKYKTKGPFCGPAGGAPKGTYPVNTKKRAIAALAYARHAPRPEGIKRCVCRHWPSLPACKSDASDGLESTVDELKVMYSDGMISKDGLFVEIMGLVSGEDIDKSCISSVLDEMFRNNDPIGALNVLGTLYNKDKDVQ